MLEGLPTQGSERLANAARHLSVAASDPSCVLVPMCAATRVNLTGTSRLVCEQSLYTALHLELFERTAPLEEERLAAMMHADEPTCRPFPPYEQAKATSQTSEQALRSPAQLCRPP